MDEQKIVDKVCKTIDKMYESHDVDDIQRVVKINKRLSFEINAERGPVGPVVNDNGEQVAYLEGDVIGMEIYAMVNDDPVDCYTVSPATDTREGIEYLARCYA